MTVFLNFIFFLDFTKKCSATGIRMLNEIRYVFEKKCITVIYQLIFNYTVNVYYNSCWRADVIRVFCVYAFVLMYW